MPERTARCPASRGSKLYIERWFDFYDNSFSVVDFRGREKQRDQKPSTRFDLGVPP